MFGSSEYKDELWVSIVEKAYAKLNGGYAPIARGKMHIAMSELTGGFPEELSLASFESKLPVLWGKIQSYEKNEYLMGAGSPDNPEGDSAVSPEGIIQRHAYQVLGAR